MRFAEYYEKQISPETPNLRDLLNRLRVAAAFAAAESFDFGPDMVARLKSAAAAADRALGPLSEDEIARISQTIVG